MSEKIWKELKDQNDLDELMNIFGRFHDSCIKESYMWTEHYVNEDLVMRLSVKRDVRVRILIQRQCLNPSAIELMFEEVTKILITPSPEDYDSLIYEATFLHTNGTFYWADDRSWIPDEQGFSSGNWISSKKVKWRDASDWMGKTLRYAPKDI